MMETSYQISRRSIDLCAPITVIGPCLQVAQMNTTTDILSAARPGTLRTFQVHQSNDRLSRKPLFGCRALYNREMWNAADCPLQSGIENVAIRLPDQNRNQFRYRVSKIGHSSDKWESCGRLIPRWFR